MRQFILNILIIIFGIIILILTSALLEINFFVKFIERRIMISIIQLIEIWLFFRIIVEFNKENNNE